MSDAGLPQFSRLIVLALVLAFAVLHGAATLAERSIAERPRHRLKILATAAGIAGVVSWAIYWVMAWARWAGLELQYHTPTVLLALAASVTFHEGVLFLLIRRSRGLLLRSAASLLLAAGITGTGAIGTLALRLPAQINLNPRMAVKAAVISLVGSWLAVWLSTDRRPRSIPVLRWPGTAAILVAFTNIGAHYAFAAAVNIQPGPITAAPQFTVGLSYLGAVAATVIIAAFLSVAALIAVTNRRLLGKSSACTLAKPGDGLFEESLVGIYQAELDGRLVDINGSCARLLGYSSRLEARGANLRAHFADRDEFTKLLLHLKLHQEIAGQELRCSKRDGATLWILHTASLIETGQNDSVLIQGTIVDITERKALEQFPVRQEEAEDANRLNSEFLPRISDDLRETNRIDLDHVEFNLQLELKAAIKPLAIAAQRKQLEFVCDIDLGLPETVVGDPARLRQILANLVGNAIKVTRQGEVVLRASSSIEGDKACLRFAVTEAGIARDFGGAGLDLPIASSLAELMGGSIRVERTPVEGSTFFFDVTLGLPRVTAPDLYKLNTAVALSGKIALVLEHRLEARRVLDSILRSWEIRPVLAASGREAAGALATAKRDGETFSFMLLDLSLPDSFDLLRLLREEYTGIPVIAMFDSAHRLQGLSHCRSFGVEAHVIKPVWRADLEEAMLGVIGEYGANAYAGAGAELRQESAEQPGPLRILLAEDNAINQKLASRLLQKQGHQVVLANNGLEALNAMLTESFDAVLMDVQMPGMGGLEATRLFRQQEAPAGRRQVIIAMTAHALSGDREKCLDAGMDDYISKPFNVAELYALLKKISLRNEISA
jgi:PAS domain S-box-containing protein